MITSIRQAPVRTTGRPGLAESADPIRSALGTRQRPSTSRPPRTVLRAVRLMHAGGVVELSAVVTIVGITGSVKSVVLGRNPGLTAKQWRATTPRHHVPGLRAVVARRLAAWARAGEVVIAPARRPDPAGDTRQGAAPWLAQHTPSRTSGASCRPPADGQRGSCWLPPAPDTRGWNARHSAQAQPPRHDACYIAQSDHHEEETQMIQPYPGFRADAQHGPDIQSAQTQKR
jgi:hypothetical protein